MSTPLLELEGTVEEIQERLANFAGQRLRVTITLIEDAQATPPLQMTITEKILERFRDVPPEERAKVPPDLTDNLDHYIYGLPKK
jgi:hypothetical protein